MKLQYSPLKSIAEREREREKKHGLKTVYSEDTYVLEGMTIEINEHTNNNEKTCQGHVFIDLLQESKHFYLPLYKVT